MRGQGVCAPAWGEAASCGVERLVPRQFWEFTAVFQQLANNREALALEMRLLCVGPRQQSRGGGRSQRATPTHRKGSRQLRGGEWEVLVEDWTGQPRPDPGGGCRALSCLPGELWRVPR